MGYYIICSIFLLFFFISLGYALTKDYKRINNKFSRLLFCSILAIVFKYNYGLLFCGLEYEDSYAFSFIARQFANNIYTTSFLSDGIGVGSLRNPELMQTYGGHFITYSTLLSYPIKFFGFSFTLINIITTFINFISLLILSVFPTVKGKYLWMVAPSLFCVAPVINVFSNSFLCEPFSGMIVLAFCYLYYQYINSNVGIFFPLITFALALMTKRENLALLSLPLVYNFCNIIKNEFQNVNCLKEGGLFVSTVLLYFLCFHNIFNIETIESSDINAPTFSLLYFLKLAPGFIKALVTPKYFGLVFYLFVIVVLYNYTTFKKNCFEFALIILWFVYFALYTCHYRGYFFITEGEFDIFESFRYLNNFYSIIPVVISMIAIRFKRNIVISIIIVLLSLSIYPTYAIRREYHDLEQYNRFEIPQLVLDIIQKHSNIHESTIIASDLLIYQNLVDEDTRLCYPLHIGYLNLNDPRTDYYLICREDEIPYFYQRYGIGIDLQEWSLLTKLYDYNIYTINK